MIYSRIISATFFILYFLFLSVPTLATNLDVCKDAGWTEEGECNQNNCVNRVGDVGSIECYGCSTDPKTKVCCSKFKDQANQSLLSPRVVGCVDYKITNTLYDTTSTPDDVLTKSEPIEFIPQVTIPGTVFTKGNPIVVDGDTLGQYIANFYKFFTAIIAVIAVVMIMWGGFKRIAAAGSAETIQNANSTITSAIVGLVIALMSYSLLQLVNPALISFKSLQIEPIRAESFSVRPALLENPNLQTTSDAYKTQNCPSVSELAAGVKFFITGYYKPAYGDKEKYQSFECNVAMQCSCPEPPGRSNEYSCKTAGNKTWRPCNNFDSSKSYCNKTSTGVEPTAWQTAATSSCLPKGTVFKVFGSKLPTVNSKVWVAEDSGGWITGRRVDLFTGQGSDAYKQAVDLTGEVMIKVCPNNDKTKCS